MKKHCWLAIRVATDLPIDLLAIADFEHSVLVGLNQSEWLHVVILAQETSRYITHQALTRPRSVQLGSWPSRCHVDFTALDDSFEAANRPTCTSAWGRALPRAIPTAPPVS